MLVKIRSLKTTAQVTRCDVAVGQDKFYRGLRIIVSLSLLAAVIVGGFYLYGHDPDGAKCDASLRC
jgi:predicted secreted protein